MKSSITHYNKLIRDNIPAKMDKKGIGYEARKLSAKEYEQELLKKVSEEASGVAQAKTKSEIIAELADLLDVIDEVKRLKNIKPSELKNAQKENTKRKGGFKKRLFLLWSSNADGYKTNKKTSTKKK